MNMILIGIGGIVSALFMFLGITWIKKSDEEHGLPQRIGVFIILFTIIAGSITTYVVYPSYLYMFLFVFFTAYLAIMAYTDFYVMKLYTIFHIGAAIIGYITLFGTKFSIKEILLSVGFAIFMKFIKVINIGDVELLFASFPYLYLLADHVKMDRFSFFFFFLIVALFFGVFMNFKGFIAERKKEAPFAVPLFTAYMLIIVCMLFIKKGN